MLKIGLLIIIATFLPAGHAYSPAPASFTKPHANKITEVTKPQASPQMQMDTTRTPSRVNAYVQPLPKSNVAPTQSLPSPVPSDNTPSASNLPNAYTDGKADAPCTGFETVGRCADKCPAPEFQRGIDKTTGAAICGYVTGCPYGDSVPLGDMCYKNCLNTNPQAVTDPTVCYQGTGYSQ